MYPSNGGYTVMEEATLFAIWAIDTHTITMYRNDGTSTTITGLVEHGHKYDFPSMTRIGYIFVGWNTNSSGTGTFYTDDSIISEDLTVYAIWRAAPTCTVTYSAEYAGSGYDIPDDPDDSIEYDYNETGLAINITNDIPTIQGLEFVGWVQTFNRPLTQQTVYHPTESVVELSDGTRVQAQNTIFVRSGQTVRLLAVYNVQYCEFILHANDSLDDPASNMPTSIKCATYTTNGSLLVFGGPPTRHVYTFVGWCLYQNPEGWPIYRPGDVIGNIIVSQMDIYAVWRPARVDENFYWTYPLEHSQGDVDNTVFKKGPQQEITLRYYSDGHTENHSVFRAEYWNHFVTTLRLLNKTIDEHGLIHTGYSGLNIPVNTVIRGSIISASLVNQAIGYLNILCGLLGLSPLPIVSIDNQIGAQIFLDIKKN